MLVLIIVKVTLENVDVGVAPSHESLASLMHMMGTSGGIHQAPIYHRGSVKYSASTLLIHSRNLETDHMSDPVMGPHASKHCCPGLREGWN